ncbi:hypothetical protein ACORG1_11035 [Mycobacterium sp. TJFP1]
MTEQTETTMVTAPARDLMLSYKISEDLIEAAKDAGVRFGLIEMMQSRIRHDVLTAIDGPQEN